MSDVLKYSVGIDVSKDDYKCCFSQIDREQRVKVKSTRTFGKTQFPQLKAWMENNRKEPNVPLVVLLEATGVYHEQLSWDLYLDNYRVVILLPNKAKRYLQALGLKSKNDKIDARGLARMGAEQHLELWQPVSKRLYELRALTRQHQRLQEIKTSFKNQLHALEHSRTKVETVEEQLKSSLALVENQIKEMLEAIHQLIATDDDLKKRIDNICQIKGVALLTVATIVAETDGFALVNNQRQLTSYAGYDVRENQSGHHVGKTRISKKGNSRIRRALHMPAFNAVKYEPCFKALHERVFDRTRMKMKGYVAVQRKLLTVIYALWEKQEAYNPEYHQKTSGNHETKHPSFSNLVEAEAKPKLEHNGIHKIKTDRPKKDLPALDGLPYKQSTEALFQ